MTTGVIVGGIVLALALLDQPQVVIDAIREIVEAARR